MPNRFSPNFTGNRVILVKKWSRSVRCTRLPILLRRMRF
ncbi:Uncharacterised protein [Vibrio cholerae]|nr:Uncharacterised protein [Vibrio cholerae]CSI94205.1 Uncharacterised protein [Vibrio cholerae]